MLRRKHLVAAGTICFVAGLLALLTFLTTRNAHISAGDFPSVIARIEGDDLEVVTSTPLGVEKDAAPTAVASGSEVTVRSGHALLLLNAGGEISVCGPAHFKVIKSSGSLTLALDYGRVHPSLDTSDELTIYTPAIVATPIAIAGGRRDITLGLEQSGAMCVLTSRGAMRVEPQFAEQSMIVPQGGTVSLFGGQIESLQADPSSCGCEFPRAQMETPRPSPDDDPLSAMSVGALAPPLPPEQRRIENLPPPSAPASQPVYTVLMPPLSFNAASPIPPPAPSPETILLVREVRLRPAAEFRGRVNPAPPKAEVAAVAPAAAEPPAAPVIPVKEPEPAKPGLIERVRSFFHSFSSSAAGPCAGAGCR